MVEVGFQLAQAAIRPRVACHHTPKEGSDGVNRHVHGGTAVLDLGFKGSNQLLVHIAMEMRGEF